MIDLALGTPEGCRQRKPLEIQHRNNATHCKAMLNTGWRRPIGCLISCITFRKLATNYKALLRKMTLTIRHPMSLRHPVAGSWDSSRMSAKRAVDTATHCNTHATHMQHAAICVYMYIYISQHIHTYTCIYIYIHIYMYLHVYMYIYIHMYI